MMRFENNLQTLPAFIMPELTVARHSPSTLAFISGLSSAARITKSFHEVWRRDCLDKLANVIDDYDFLDGRAVVAMAFLIQSG